MKGIDAPGPFSTRPLDEVPLPHAPLVRVIAQIRWATVSQLKYDLDGIVQRFALRVSESYPIVQRRDEVQLVLSPEGVDRKSAGTVHIFVTADGGWTISLSDSFLALETNSYVSREDFCGRLLSILSALKREVKIPRVERIGFRYVNRIDQEEVYEHIHELIDESLLGGAKVPLDGGRVVHSLSETLFQKDDVNLLARWAWLPPGATVDPTMSGSPKRSWLLDLDAFSSSMQVLDPERNVETISNLSQVAYRFFRWAVKPAFLTRFGGS